mgnify:CR=1 FL=1
MKVTVKRSVLESFVQAIVENRKVTGGSGKISKLELEDDEPIKPTEMMATQIAVALPNIDDDDFVPGTQEELSAAAQLMSKAVPDDQIAYFYKKLHKILDMADDRHKDMRMTDEYKGNVATMHEALKRILEGGHDEYGSGFSEFDPDADDDIGGELSAEELIAQFNQQQQTQQSEPEKEPSEEQPDTAEPPAETQADFDQMLADIDDDDDDSADVVDSSSLLDRQIERIGRAEKISQLPADLQGTDETMSFYVKIAKTWELEGVSEIPEGNMPTVFLAFFALHELSYMVMEANYLSEYGGLELRKQDTGFGVRMTIAPVRGGKMSKAYSRGLLADIQSKYGMDYENMIHLRNINRMSGTGELKNTVVRALSGMYKHNSLIRQTIDVMSERGLDKSSGKVSPKNTIHFFGDLFQKAYEMELEAEITPDLRQRGHKGNRVRDEEGNIYVIDRVDKDIGNPRNTKYVLLNVETEELKSIGQTDLDDGTYIVEDVAPDLGVDWRDVPLARAFAKVRVGKHLGDFIPPIGTTVMENSTKIKYEVVSSKIDEENSENNTYTLRSKDTEEQIEVTQGDFSNYPTRPSANRFRGPFFYTDKEFSPKAHQFAQSIKDLYPQYVFDLMKAKHYRKRLDRFVLKHDRLEGVKETVTQEEMMERIKLFIDMRVQQSIDAYEEGLGSDEAPDEATGDEPTDEELEALLQERELQKIFKELEKRANPTTFTHIAPYFGFSGESGLRQWMLKFPERKLRINAMTNDPQNTGANLFQETTRTLYQDLSRELKDYIAIYKDEAKNEINTYMDELESSDPDRGGSVFSSPALSKDVYLPIISILTAGAGSTPEDNDNLMSASSFESMKKIYDEIDNISEKTDADFFAWLNSLSSEEKATYNFTGDIKKGEKVVLKMTKQEVIDFGKNMLEALDVAAEQLEKIADLLGDFEMDSLTRAVYAVEQDQSMPRDVAMEFEQYGIDKSEIVEYAEAMHSIGGIMIRSAVGGIMDSIITRIDKPWEELVQKMLEEDYNIPAQTAKKWRQHFNGKKKVPDYEKGLKAAAEFTKAGIDYDTFFEIYEKSYKILDNILDKELDGELSKNKNLFTSKVKMYVDLNVDGIDALEGKKKQKALKNAGDALIPLIAAGLHAFDLNVELEKALSDAAAEAEEFKEKMNEINAVSELIELLL